MGCWNKTCGLTNLHITAGQKAYVFVLEKRDDDNDSHCYSTHLYRPLLLPFETTYNDYGGGEDSTGVAFPLIMEGIKQRLHEMELGENEYHDIAVTKEAFGEEVQKHYTNMAQVEIEAYGKAVTDWELIRNFERY